MYKKVLLPIRDNSDPAINQKVLEKGRQVCDGELVILHVTEPVVQTVGGENRLEVESEIKNKAMYVVAPIVHELEKDNVPFHLRLVPGTIAETIVRVAGDEKADLIIMYTDGADNLGDLFLGTITERVLRDTGADLLALRGK